MGDGETSMQTPSRKIRHLITAIQVGPYRIPVYSVADLVGDEGDRLEGLFDPAIPAIYLDSSLSSTQTQEAFFHEVVEAINNYAELDLEHSKIQTLGFLLTQALLPLIDGNQLPLDHTAPVDDGGGNEMDDS